MFLPGATAPPILISTGHKQHHQEIKITNDHSNFHKKQLHACYHEYCIGSHPPKKNWSGGPVSELCATNLTSEE
jgi:hypothetical protein